MHLLKALWWWVEVHTGTVNEAGPYYGFFSGFGSDLGELAIIGVLLNHYRAHRCQRCWRIGRFAVEGTHYRTCHHHLRGDVHVELTERHRTRHPEQHAMLSR